MPSESNVTCSSCPWPAVACASSRTVTFLARRGTEPCHVSCLEMRRGRRHVGVAGPSLPAAAPNGRICTAMTETTVIRNAAVLWGADLGLVDRTTLVLRGRSVAGLDGGIAPADATTVDAAGLLLVPGFVDAHVHIG